MLGLQMKFSDGQSEFLQVFNFAMLIYATREIREN